MATSKDYMEFVIDKSGLGDDIATRKMMGEYLLYYKGKHIGGIYDNRLLVKKQRPMNNLECPRRYPTQVPNLCFLLTLTIGMRLRM